MLSESDKRQLDERGYLVLPDLMGPALLAEVRARVEELFREEGERAGFEFKQEAHARRLANLVDKGEVFERVILTSRVLECMEHVMGPEFKLSSLNVRSADPMGDCAQPWHADSGAISDERGYWVCNSVWMLDDFTAENGATRMLPGSHRWRRLPAAECYESLPGEELVLGKAGTVVIMNAHMWHGATANRTQAPRRAMHVYYTRSDKPQQQFQKMLLRAEVQRRLSADARRVLALDDARNDEISAAGCGVSGFMK